MSPITVAFKNTDSYLGSEKKKMLDGVRYYTIIMRWSIGLINIHTSLSLFYMTIQNIIGTKLALSLSLIVLQFYISVFCVKEEDVVKGYIDLGKGCEGMMKL